MNRAPEFLTTDVSAIDRATAELARVRDEIGKIIIGQRDVIDGVLICLLRAAMSYWKEFLDSARRRSFALCRGFSTCVTLASSSRPI